MTDRRRPVNETAAYPVSTLVNNPQNDSDRCVEPVVVEGQGDFFG